MNALFENLVLLLQAGGIVLVICAVGAIAPASTSRRTAAAVVVLVLASVTFWDQVFPQFQALRQVAQNADVEPAASEDEPFLAWVEKRVGERETIHLVAPSEVFASAKNQVITYRLSPRRFTDTAEEADWVMYFDSVPERNREAQLYQYKPRFGLVDRRK